MTLGFYEFMDNWPESRKNQFSYDGKKALFDYFDELDESIEFDPVAICCDFTEYQNATEGASNYFEFEGMTFDVDGAELETRDEVEAKALKFLQDRTTVLELENGGIIIANF